MFIRNLNIIGKCKPILLLPRSVSPVIASQIEWAVNNGFEEIEIVPK